MSASADLAKEKSLLNRADFVRQFPLTVPSKDIVAKAKEQGLDIPSNYVSAVRSKMRTGNGAATPKAKKKVKAAAPSRAPKAHRKVGRPKKVAAPAPAPKAPAAKAVAPRPRLLPAGKGVDREFYQRVLDIGLVRAETLLENVKARAATLR